MASTQHTFSTSCRLAHVHRQPRAGGRPPVDARFFYSSLVPIDDPLSTSSIVGSHESKASWRQLRPFGCGDNGALEKAWLGLESETDREHHAEARAGCDPLRDAAKATGTLDIRAQLVSLLALRHSKRHRTASHPHPSPTLVEPTDGSIASSPCCPELPGEVSEELENSLCSLIRKQRLELSIENIVQDVMRAMESLRKSAEDTEMRCGTPETVSPNCPRTQSVRAPFPRSSRPLAKTAVEKDKENDPGGQAIPDASGPQRRLRGISTHANGSSHPRSQCCAFGNDDGISGKPFVRAEKVDLPSLSTPPLHSRDEGPVTERSMLEDGGDFAAPVDNGGQAPEPVRTSNIRGRDRVVDIVVGVARLHKVSLPKLHMTPIYWSPVNDIAVVMRATWFYRDTMMPVATVVANQLEAGYHELRPWTETWGDELRCAVEVGSLGEEKVSYSLWPQDGTHGPGYNHHESEPTIPSDPFCAAHCCQSEAAAQGVINPPLVQAVPSREQPGRPFANYHVIYKDETHAYLLKPSLKPSAYYGRRPVQKIMKGITVGIPVTRGFDKQTWDKAHNNPRTPGPSAVEDAHEGGGTDGCSACRTEENRGPVTDLVLVAHGIGQKFAERVESFHFTHAINGFRQAVNAEMASPIVQRVLRKGQHGLMILPLNWRMGLSFEDGGPVREENAVSESLVLKDIEPDTIPAVRSIISDVMFDIPFYMSHHKSKMINALVFEANRVYRLWCKNNPGFADMGRVHLIAHSLGSVMALDILSHQPTRLPRIDLSREPVAQYFEFDTKNLFLLGSPAAFFLLLERRALMPRRGRRKPGADPADSATRNVVGDAGTFGCLAVDNIYNILAKEDPIAYLLNGAVDPAFAASLRTAYVPSISTSFLKSFRDAVRLVVPSLSPVPDRLVSPHDRPATVRLPSQLELEVHDFTREEVAEKKAFLLNDNGQVDWFLRSGGGPLEIQYLNMLSAHTSYWTNQDFIRMLCVEIGREPGRASTLPAMRAVKATKRFSPPQ